MKLLASAIRDVTISVDEKATPNLVAKKYC